jgi:hypothetical protein
MYVLNKNVRESLVKQGKLIMVLPSADRLGCLQLKHLFDMIKWVSLAMSADGYTMILGHFDCPACINVSSMKYLRFL